MAHSAAPAHVITNKFIDFDTLTKHSPLNSKKICSYAFYFDKIMRIGFKIVKPKT